MFINTGFNSRVHLVILGHLKVGEGRGAARGVGHHPEALVDETLVVDLLEHPPDGLHEPGVHGLVVVLEVNPPAHPSNDLFPF